MGLMKLGQTFGPYQVVRSLGKGGMAEVFEVEHRHLGVRRALKVFDASGAKDADFLRKRFLAEGRLLARLDHPRLVKVHDLGIDEATGVPWLAMDYVVGPKGVPQTLADVREAGAGTDERVGVWYADLREALEAVHAAGVVHRDVKLENVLVGADGHVLLSDFGISRIENETLRAELALTKTLAADETPNARKVLGTIAYLPPEVRKGGEVTAAADWWALGVSLFRLLTGMWYEPGPSAGDLLIPFDPAWKTVFTALLAEAPERRSAPPLVRRVVASRHAKCPWGLVVAILAVAVIGGLFAWRALSCETGPDLSTAFDVPETLK